MNIKCLLFGHKWKKFGGIHKKSIDDNKFVQRYYCARCEKIKTEIVYEVSDSVTHLSFIRR